MVDLGTIIKKKIGTPKNLYVNKEVVKNTLDINITNYSEEILFTDKKRWPKHICCS